MSEPDERDMKKCQKCKKPVDGELHSCPFQADVHNDNTPCCNCCDDCAHECAMDI